MHLQFQNWKWQKINFYSLKLNNSEPEPKIPFNLKIFRLLKDVCTFYMDMWSRPIPEQNCLSPQNRHIMIILGWGKTCFHQAESIFEYQIKELKPNIKDCFTHFGISCVLLKIFLNYQKDDHVPALRLLHIHCSVVF